MREVDSFDRAVAINRFSMRLVGFWPLDTRFYYNLQYGVIFTIIIVFMFPAVVQLSTLREWDSLMHQSLQTIPIFPLLARFVFMKTMNRNFRIILRAMIADWAYHRCLSRRDQRIMIHYAKRGRQFNVLSVTLMMLSLIGYIFTPIVNTWLKDLPWNATTKTLPHEGFYPLSFKESPTFEILYIVQIYYAFFGTVGFISVDCFLYIIVFHACGQFDILSATLERYNSSMRHDYAMDHARSHTCACLSCIVKRHVNLLSYMDIIEKSFRDSILLQLLGYWFNLVFQGRELIVNIRRNNFNGIITCVIYVFTIMYHIFIYCYVSECIIEKSENIGRIAHDLEWQRFPRDSNLPIIVARSRMPCKITAGRFVTMSFSYYTTILATTISYISVLAAFK